MPFVYVKIPLVAGVAQRLDTLHALVQDALAAGALGEISSWGSSLAGSGRGARAAATHHRLDIELGSLAAALPLLRQTLAAAPVPAGTELHYTEEGRPLQQCWSAAGWSTAVPSSATHRPANG